MREKEIVQLAVWKYYKSKNYEPVIFDHEDPMVHGLFYNSFIIPKAPEHIDKVLNEMREIKNMMIKIERDKEMDLFEGKIKEISIGVYVIPIYNMTLQKVLG